MVNAQHFVLAGLRRTQVQDRAAQQRSRWPACTACERQLDTRPSARWVVASVDARGDPDDRLSYDAPAAPPLPGTTVGSPRRIFLPGPQPIPVQTG